MEQSAKPISVGTGLVALDWLLIGNARMRPNETYAGGSCGNVMAILAFLGWESFPIARLARDRRAEKVKADLEQFDVRTDFLLQEQKGVTPVIIVRVKERPDGTIVSRFEWRHPESGEWLPRYRPFPKTTAQRLVNELPEAKVFYFDRAEPSSLVIAQFMRQRGATVIFEPSSASDAHLFSECLALADIVKYSAERLENPPENPISRSPRLEIQTLGAGGLRFRVKANSTRPGSWRYLEPYVVKHLRDSTGCGDWCSAGLITMLCSNGRDEFLKLSEKEIVAGLRFGQALASMKCGYLGARGPMYSLSANEVLAAAKCLRKPL